MPKATTDWNNVETWQKLVTAIIATGVKIDTRATAKYFGTTYDTVENRLRKNKQEAKALQDGANIGTTTAPSPRHRASVPDNPGKSRKTSNLHAVKQGRVAKKPRRRASKAAILQDDRDEDDDEAEDEADKSKSDGEDGIQSIDEEV